MMALYFWSSFFHILLAIFWIGGMLFTVLVLVPVSRDAMFENRRGKFFMKAGTVFSRITWIAFLLLVISGVLNLLGKGFRLQDLVSTTFWQSGYGNSLAWKLGLFGLVLIQSAIHDFWLGPKASLLMDQQPETSLTRRYRKASSW